MGNCRSQELKEDLESILCWTSVTVEKSKYFFLELGHHKQKLWLTWSFTEVFLNPKSKTFFLLLNWQKRTTSIAVPPVSSVHLSPVSLSHGSLTRVKFSYWKGDIEAETLQPQKQAV